MIKRKITILIFQILALLSVVGVSVFLSVYIVKLTKKTLPDFNVSKVEDEVSKEIDNYKYCSETIGNNIELKSRSTFKRTYDEKTTISIPKTYTLNITKGDAIKKDKVIASYNDENITMPFDGRIISVDKETSDSSYTLTLDPFSNYTIHIYLSIDKYQIYQVLSESDKKVSVRLKTDNDTVSYAYVDNIFFNDTKRLYEVTFNQLTFNPYILNGYEVSLYKMIKPLPSHLLFSKKFYYKVIDNKTITAKRIENNYINGVTVEEITEVTLTYDREDSDYFYVLEPSKNKGCYILQ